MPAARPLLLRLRREARCSAPARRVLECVSRATPRSAVDGFRRSSGGAASTSRRSRSADDADRTLARGAGAARPGGPRSSGFDAACATAATDPPRVDRGRRPRRPRAAPRPRRRATRPSSSSRLGTLVYLPPPERAEVLPAIARSAPAPSPSKRSRPCPRSPRASTGSSRRTDAFVLALDGSRSPTAPRTAIGCPGSTPAGRPDAAIAAT